MMNRPHPKRFSGAPENLPSTLITDPVASRHDVGRKPQDLGGAFRASLGWKSPHVVDARSSNAASTDAEFKPGCGGMTVNQVMLTQRIRQAAAKAAACPLAQAL
jgi:hypothetical protein